MKEQMNIEKIIELAIIKAGKEKDMNDIAVLRSFIKEREQRNKKKKFRLIFSSIAAIIVLVLIINIYQDNHKLNQLFETYYTPFEYDRYLISRGEDDLSVDLVEIMSLYNQQKYEEALQMFNVIHNNLNRNYLIYKAICLIETDKLSEAETLLKDLIEEGEGTEYFQQANWYLALTFLKQGNKKELNDLLLFMKEEKSAYSDKVNMLIEDLK